MSLNGNPTVEFTQTQWAALRRGMVVAVCLLFASVIGDCALLAQAPKRHQPPEHFRRLPAQALNKKNDFMPASRVAAPRRAERVHLDEMVYQVSYTSDANPTPDTQTRPQYSWTYKLKNLHWKQFESKLADIWGERLMGTPLDDERRSVRLFLPEGKTAPEASIKFDRIAGLLTYEGSPSRLGGWNLMMQLLDRVEHPHDKYGAQVIDIGLLDQNFVRQVAFTFQDQDREQDTIPRSEIPDLTDQDIRNLKGALDRFPNLSGQVEIRLSEETGSLVLIGEREDLDKVKSIIAELFSDQSMVNTGSKAIQLFNSEPDDLRDKIQEIYDGQFIGIHGPAIISSNPSSNSLLVVGSKGGISEIEKLIRSFDGDSATIVDNKELNDLQKGFKTFPLKYISAIEAQNAVLTLFGQNNNQAQTEQRQPLPVTTQINQRNNSLTVFAAPNLIRRAEALIRDMDIDLTEMPNKRTSRVLRVFTIRNHQAGDFAVILQDALNGGQQGNVGVTEGSITPIPPQPPNQNDPRNPAITPLAGLSIADEDGVPGRVGDFFDVRITADNPSNSIIVQAREESMELIKQLIDQLDKPPQLEADVKVFPIINGDATEVLQTLLDLFGGDQAAAGAAGQTPGSVSNLPLQSPATDGTSLINIRFAVNERTNTITASGSQSDLEFVEALIYRLDEEDVQDRQTGVYRLSNANVVDVATAVRDTIDGRQGITDASPTTGGGVNSNGLITARRSIIIVEEETSNSLIINARPEHFAEIEHLIYSLDRRPPMVKVKAMIVEVDLNQLENFGVEFGVQDSEIFESGLVDTIGTGFVGLDNPAGQLLSDLGVGRASAAAGGISGLILSAGDESLNFVVRSLKQKGCANVLFSPSVMTLENLTGAVQVGATIQRLGGVTSNNAGQQMDINDVPIGVNLSITPRVTPDGMVVMFVDVSNTSLGSIAEGVSLGTDMNGAQIISQPINNTSAQTTIMARSGQTVAISGLFQEQKSQTINSVPFLGDLPVIGPLFQSVENSADRSELLIILTPYIVDGPDDIAALNEDDFSRMHWCKCDIAELYGDTEFSGGNYYEHTPKKFYPASDPLAANAALENADAAADQMPQSTAPEFDQQLAPQDDRWQQQQLDGSGTRQPAGSGTREPNGSGTREPNGSGTRLPSQPTLDYPQQNTLPAPQSSQYPSANRQQNQLGQPQGYQQQSYRQQGYPSQAHPVSAPRGYNQQLPARQQPYIQTPFESNPNGNGNYLPDRQANPSGPLPPQRHSNSQQAAPTQHNLTDRSAPRQTYTRQQTIPAQQTNQQAVSGNFQQNNSRFVQQPYPSTAGRSATNSPQQSISGANGRRFRLIDTR